MLSANGGAYHDGLPTVRCGGPSADFTGCFACPGNPHHGSVNASATLPRCLPGRGVGSWAVRIDRHVPPGSGFHEELPDRSTDPHSHPQASEPLRDAPRSATAVALLAVDDLTKRFGGVTAVSKISFEIAEGEILGLMGPNGAGKSTLFALLSGMLPPTSGRITFQGTNISRWAPHRRCHHGLVQTFQLAQAFPDLTVEQNVRVGAVFGAGRRPKGGPAPLSVEEVLEMTNLSDRRDARSNELTLAGRKRLEVARALAACPRLLLLDEVMAGLNPTELAEIVEIIRRIHARQITLLVTEHVVESLFQLIHRVLVLHHGQLLFNGDVRAASEDPAVLEAYLGKAEDTTTAALV